MRWQCRVPDSECENRYTNIQRYVNTQYPRTQMRPNFVPNSPIGWNQANTAVGGQMANQNEGPNVARLPFNNAGDCRVTQRDNSNEQTRKQETDRNQVNIPVANTLN